MSSSSEPQDVQTIIPAPWLGDGIPGADINAWKVVTVGGHPESSSREPGMETQFFEPVLSLVGTISVPQGQSHVALPCRPGCLWIRSKVHRIDCRRGYHPDSTLGGVRIQD